ncbi:FliH/SctL family protein [Austwickia sp. TVS 96-490-7B]|uniref:FliH/SctL family protein n=1 Tax=Austwickia sp. TVS 96-490-7B TaxID=2830843 RepID=UPI001C5903D6|nr:FliH/SctL family protein [Austwickia sp. TVS 96-490-7B]
MPNGRSQRGYVIRGSEHPSPVRPARLSSDLRSSEFLSPGIADPRLVDPHLEAVVEQAAMEARARGFRAGHAAGYAAGREEGLALLDEQRQMLLEQDDIDRQRHAAYLQDLVTSVSHAVADALQVQVPTLEELYDVVATMTVELAEGLVGHHLSVDGCGAKDAMLRAMQQAPRGAKVTLRLNPADVLEIQEYIDGVPEWGDVTVVADPSVEVHGALAQADNVEIDAQYGPAFERVRRVVRP